MTRRLSSEWPDEHATIPPQHESHSLGHAFLQAAPAHTLQVAEPLRQAAVVHLLLPSP